MPRTSPTSWDPAKAAPAQGLRARRVHQDGKLWRVPNTGGEPQQVGVELTKTRIKTPNIDPAGKRLAFGAFEADNNEIWTLEHFLPATVSAVSRDSSH